MNYCIRCRSGCTFFCFISPQISNLSTSFKSIFPQSTSHSFLPTPLFSQLVICWPPHNQPRSRHHAHFLQKSPLCPPFHPLNFFPHPLVLNPIHSRTNVGIILPCPTPVVFISKHTRHGSQNLFKTPRPLFISHSRPPSTQPLGIDSIINNTTTQLHLNFSLSPLSPLDCYSSPSSF